MQHATDQRLWAGVEIAVQSNQGAVLAPCATPRQESHAKHRVRRAVTGRGHYSDWLFLKMESTFRMKSGVSSAGLWLPPNSNIATKWAKSNGKCHRRLSRRTTNDFHKRQEQVSWQLVANCDQRQHRRFNRVSFTTVTSGISGSTGGSIYSVSVTYFHAPAESRGHRVAVARCLGTPVRFVTNSF